MIWFHCWLHWPHMNTLGRLTALVITHRLADLVDWQFLSSHTDLVDWQILSSHTDSWLNFLWADCFITHFNDHLFTQLLDWQFLSSSIEITFAGHPHLLVSSLFSYITHWLTESLCAGNTMRDCSLLEHTFVFGFDNFIVVWNLLFLR